jgi:cytochrome c-type biogenesis protein
MYDVAGLFLLGLVYGATTCSLTCLPYLGPYLLSTGRGFKDGVKSSLLFLSGKLVCYMFVGGLSAYLGNVLMPEQSMTARWVTGIAIIAFGLSIPFVRGECSRKGQTISKGISLFLLGLSTSLIPCPPLMAIFLVAAKSGSLVLGITYGLVYGLGLAISPMIIACGVLSLIARSLRIEVNGIMPYLKTTSTALIVFMGVRMII